MAPSYNATMAKTFDICIRGAGVVGRTLALLLARERLRVALVAAPSPSVAPTGDVRAYALNAASHQLLDSLRSWPDPAHATAITQMQVFGDQGGAVHFDAATQGVDALAWIVDVPALEARLAEAVRYQPQVEVVSEPVPATLTVVCEGRASRTRSEFGVAFEVARQWFLPDGILAFLPLEGAQGNSVAVVWSVSKDQVPQLLALAPQEFAQRLEAASQGALGALQLQGERAAWPLQQAQANRWCGALPAQGVQPRSWVLAGDAAHNVHPLAGQGLNMGLADAQTLERERKAAMLPMGLATDGLQQLFARAEGPWQALRNWGMKGFGAQPPRRQH